jgi:hypothetical protein
MPLQASEKLGWYEIMRLHKTAIRLAAFMALTGSLVCSGLAQTNSQRSRQAEPTEVKGFSDSDKAALSRQISSAVSRGDVPGVVALIVGREGVLYEGAAGKSRLPKPGRPSTGPSQIVWRQLRHADALGGFLHNVPNRLHRHAISPRPSNFVDPEEQFSSINSSCGEPIVEFGSHPIRSWNCSNVASLADQINNGPMLFALLEVIQSQRHRFMPSQAAREQQCS